jgi:GNAT superfamily N-acetyltransferase
VAVTIDRVEDPATLLNLRDAVADVYYRAYSLPPYFENQADVGLLKAKWPALISKPKFRLVIARAQEREGLMGFAYGWRSTEGDDLRAVFLEKLGPAELSLWTADSFEIADFAILPEEQGKGVGKELYSAFFKGIEEKRGVLKTHCSDSIEVQMYRRRGWATLIEQFVWGPKNLPYTAMGIQL